MLSEPIYGAGHSKGEKSKEIHRTEVDGGRPPFATEF
jgi:hypothetical protein